MVDSNADQTKNTSHSGLEAIYNSIDCCEIFSNVQFQPIPDSKNFNWSPKSGTAIGTIVIDGKRTFYSAIDISTKDHSKIVVRTFPVSNSNSKTDLRMIVPLVLFLDSNFHEIDRITWNEYQFENNQGFPINHTATKNKPASAKYMVTIPDQENKIDEFIPVDLKAGSAIVNAKRAPLGGVSYWFE